MTKGVGHLAVTDPLRGSCVAPQDDTLADG